MTTRTNRGLRAPATKLHLGVLFLLLAAGSPRAFAQAETGEAGKIVQAASASGDRFGNALALRGDLAVVGAPFKDGSFLNTGAAYIFRLNAGPASQEAALAAPSGASKDDWFGSAVATDGDWVLVGAPQFDTSYIDDGAVFVYRDIGAGWVQMQKLTAPDAGGPDRFGAAVAIDGDTLLVGATGDDGVGSAYVYRFDGSAWVFEAKLQESGLSAGAAFGTAVTLHAGDALVGAPLQNGGGTVWAYQNAGSAWTSAATLTATDNGGADQFGNAIAFDGDNAIISAHLQDQGGGAVQNTGAAYIFAFDGSAWTQTAKLTAEGDASAQAYFGFSVDIAGPTAVVGAFQAHTAADDYTGAVYVFRDGTSGWERDMTLVPTDVSAGDFFGHAVSGCDTVLVGAPGDVPVGASGQRYGSAYTFNLPPAGPTDTDLDGISDDDEINLYGTNPNSADTDGDGLTDPEEIFTYTTDPTDDDTDDDLLTDGEEINLAAFGGCPDPLVFDSDADGIGDGEEHLLGFDPCDADMDNDGLTDGLEISFGTDPLTPDTDGDGLLDGTEVDMAMGSGCPDPLAADSDGDTLSDAAEGTLGTDPCSADTDGDGLNDAVDDQPTIPGVSSGYLEDYARDLATMVGDFPLASFKGPNNNARRGRRAALEVRMHLVAAFIAWDIPDVAEHYIRQVILPRLDGQPRPSDWMVDGPDKDNLYSELELLADLIALSS